MNNLDLMNNISHVSRYLLIKEFKTKCNYVRILEYLTTVNTLEHYRKFKWHIEKHTPDFNSLKQMQASGNNSH